MQEDRGLASEMISELKQFISKLYVLIVVIVLASFVTIGGVVGCFIWYLNQYDFYSTETTTEVESISENGGDAHAVLNDEGQVIINGESESNENNKNES